MEIQQQREETKYTNRNRALWQISVGDRFGRRKVGGDLQGTRALLLVDHHAPGVYLLIRAIAPGRLVLFVVSSAILFR